MGILHFIWYLLLVFSFSFLSFSTPSLDPHLCSSFLSCPPCTSGCFFHCLSYILFIWVMIKFCAMMGQYILPCPVWFKCIDCPLVPLYISANIGVPWWLPSQPFVILLSLTGLWPDTGYKSNQKLRGQDTGMCPHQGPSAPLLIDTDVDYPTLMHYIWLFCLSNAGACYENGPTYSRIQ